MLEFSALLDPFPIGCFRVDGALPNSALGFHTYQSQGKHKDEKKTVSFLRLKHSNGVSNAQGLALSFSGLHRLKGERFKLGIKGMI